MKMRRHYFISNYLGDLDALKQELESGGISFEQIHVLSHDDAGLEKHHLHQVHSILKKDVIHSAEIGVLIGLGASVLVLLMASISGLPETVTWVPFVFLSVIVLGFCTWEGGLLGIQIPNSNLRRFNNALENKKHIFFVDIELGQEHILRKLVGKYPQLESAGEGSSVPSWLIHWQQGWHKFVKWAP